MAGFQPSLIGRFWVSPQAQEAQAAHISAVARAKGLDLIGMVDDSGKSALDMSRQGLKQILAAAAENRIDVVIVRDLFRLARDPDDLRDILNALTACGVEVIESAT